MPNPDQKTVKEIKISKKRAILFVVIAIVIVILAIGSNMLRRSVGLGVGSSDIGHYVPTVTTTSMPVSGMYYEDEAMPHYEDRNVEQTIADTREYIKTNYSAMIQTRDVSDAVEKAENLVHEMDGRVDNLNISERYGSLSFVIPKSNLYEFRDQIEKMTHKKLITENISSQNLLGEKQIIEQNAEIIAGTLAELTDQKKKLENTHAARIKNLQDQITLHQSAIATPPESLQGAELEASQSYHQNYLSQLQQQKAEEQNSYTKKRNSLIASIKQAGGALDENAEKDIDFINKVETVQGSLSMQYIGWWKLVALLSPIPMIVYIFVILIAGWIILRRTRIMPRIVLV